MTPTQKVAERRPVAPSEDRPSLTKRERQNRSVQNMKGVFLNADCAGILSGSKSLVSIFGDYKFVTRVLSTRL